MSKDHQFYPQSRTSLPPSLTSGPTVLPVQDNSPPLPAAATESLAKHKARMQAREDWKE